MYFIWFMFLPCLSHFPKLIMPSTNLYMKTPKKRGERTNLSLLYLRFDNANDRVGISDMMHFRFYRGVPRLPHITPSK